MSFCPLFFIEGRDVRRCDVYGMFKKLRDLFSGASNCREAEASEHWVSKLLSSFGTFIHGAQSDEAPQPRNFQEKWRRVIGCSLMAKSLADSEDDDEPDFGEESRHGVDHDDGAQDDDDDER